MLDGFETMMAELAKISKTITDEKVQEKAIEAGVIPNCNLFKTNKIINTLTQKINNRLNSCV